MIIVFEGQDGLGKTTQALLLAKKLGCEYIKLPNEKVFSGQILRKILNKELPFEPASFQALQVIDKMLAAKEILAAEAESGFVILDRFLLSSIAYGKADGLPEDWIDDINKFLLKPDVTFLFEGESFKLDKDIYGSKEHQAKVAEIYTTCDDPSIVHINANRDIDAIHREICARVNWA
jgi:dTMP kinase